MFSVCLLSLDLHSLVPPLLGLRLLQSLQLQRPLVFFVEFASFVVRCLVLLFERRHLLVQYLLPPLFGFIHSRFQVELLVLLGQFVYEYGVFDPLDLRDGFLLHIVDLLLFE